MRIKFFFFICILIICSLVQTNSLLCQFNILKNDYSPLKFKQKNFSLVKEKDIKYFRFFAGSGIHFQFYADDRQNTLFAIGITPQLTKNLYLTARVDGHNMHFHPNMNEIMYGVGALYGTKFLTKNLYLFAGGTFTFHVLGERGIDFSAIPLLGLEYQIARFFAVNTEIRKPIYFYKDSGHNQLILNFNLVFKI